MKPFILFLRIAAVVFTTNVAPQSLVRCNDKVTYWVIPDGKYYYTVKLRGDIDLSHQHDILNVDDKALQYTLADTSRYTNKENDESILVRYITEETIYLRSKFNTSSLNSYREIISLSSGKTAVLWYFELPEGKNKEVMAQLFANVVIGNRIFGLGSPLFAGEDFDALRVFLTEGIATATITEQTESLCDTPLPKRGE
jgi:hypothetical protein